ncbi:MAG: hypothetical protein JSW23_01775, partial [Planctomycetota bacterium]
MVIYIIGPFVLAVMILLLIHFFGSKCSAQAVTEEVIEPKESDKERVRTLYIFFIIIFVLSIVLYFHITSAPGMVASFKEIATFTREDEFYNSFIGHTLLQLEIIGNGEKQEWPVDHPMVPSWPRNWIVHPDGES